MITSKEAPQIRKINRRTLLKTGVLFGASNILSSCGFDKTSENQPEQPSSIKELAPTVEPPITVPTPTRTSTAVPSPATIDAHLRMRAWIEKYGVNLPQEIVSEMNTNNEFVIGYDSANFGSESIQPQIPFNP